MVNDANPARAIKLLTSQQVVPFLSKYCFNMKSGAVMLGMVSALGCGITLQVVLFFQIWSRRATIDTYLYVNSRTDAA